MRNSDNYCRRVGIEWMAGELLTALREDPEYVLIVLMTRK